MVVELVRLENTSHGAVSIIKIDKHIFCAGLEPPDRANAQNTSCIPTGQYEIRPVNSPKFGRTYEVLNVPGRSFILFHAGNTKVDTEGCILVGETIGKLLGNRAVLNSGATFKRFMETLGINGGPHSLTITEHY